MKKILLVLGMLTCILGLTACGSKVDEPAAGQQITIEDASVYADQLIETINAIVQAGAEDQYASDETIMAAFDSWKSAQAEMGSYMAVVGHEMEADSDSTTITATVQGSERNAEVEIILDENLQLTSITTNVKYTLGESMIKAMQNTIIGMGTVFVVLILISLIIWAFVLIPKVQAAFSGKDKAESTAKAETPAAAVSVPAAAAVEEELSDDLELVAVITAAIAASEESVPADGFIVRSIRRANTNKWQRA